MISNEGDLVIFSNTAYKAKDGKSTYVCVMTLNGDIIDAGAI